jgi:uncharacterized protein YaaQ
MVRTIDRIRAFVTRLAPAAVCDDCIAERLELSVRQQAIDVTRELAGTQGFVRQKGPCALCGADKLVIRGT